MPGNSRVKCAAKRCTSGTRLGRSEPLAKRSISAAGHGEPVRRDLTGLMGIAYRQRVLKNGLHVGGEGRARMIAGDQPTSAQQRCHTRLMSGGGKLPIGRPAICCKCSVTTYFAERHYAAIDAAIASSAYPLQTSDAIGAAAAQLGPQVIALADVDVKLGGPPRA